MARHAQITQNNKFAISLQYLKKELSDEVGFLHADKHESLLQIDSMILMGMVKHSQSSQSSKFAMWPSGLRHCNKNRKVPGWNPTRHSVRLRDPTSLRGSWWSSSRKCKTQWLTLCGWGSPLDNGPKLVVGQPNSSFNKKKSQRRS